ncbi:MAG TPA: transglycosylase SLT domain-containing protein [Pseudolabrys sp.]|nr:transglycosylase SLT domain-containing protein [Pseudolabrys sp.]
MAVTSATASAVPQITGAIRQAAKSSGISFEYLMTTAKIESNMNPAAQASTSSAKGLYQFIDQTWLGTLKGGGAAAGYGKYADAISQTPDGRFEVADPAMRNAIMQLRSDPAASAMMAGAFTRSNADHLSTAIGRQPTEGELYIAHFLGSDGASKLIGVASTQPQANAAAMFPRAAAANPSIFYDRSGSPRSAGDVYANLAGKFEVARAVNFAPAAGRADVVQAQVQTQTQGGTQPKVPDTAGVTQAFADANDHLPALPDTKPLFQAMFTDRARKAVTQTVSSLWAPAKTQASDQGNSAPPAAARSGQGLDLFSDSPSDIRKMFRGSV